MVKSKPVAGGLEGCYGGAMAHFNVSKHRGFLPIRDPLSVLPQKEFRLWEETARILPELLAKKELGAHLFDFPILMPDAACTTEREYERMMLLLSFFAHGHVFELWQDNKVRLSIPKGVAVPLVHIAQKLGRPPVLSYASYALYNWRRIDPRGPITLENLELLQHFLTEERGARDEAWFVLIHVVIEAQAAQAITAAERAQKGAEYGACDTVKCELRLLAEAQERMYKTLCRMPEQCDPSVYYNFVRPFIHGWKGHPLLPLGMEYQGVGEFQQWRGETGAQSSIIPLLDATLNIPHEDSPLTKHLRELRDYMPVQHRALLYKVEQHPSIAEYAASKRGASIVPFFNECVDQLARFREKHLEYAARYIQQQNAVRRAGANPTGIGTGGTPFMPSLTKHMRETSARKIKG